MLLSYHHYLAIFVFVSSLPWYQCHCFNTNTTISTTITREHSESAYLRRHWATVPVHVFPDSMLRKCCHLASHLLGCIYPFPCTIPDIPASLLLPATFPAHSHLGILIGSQYVITNSTTSLPHLFLWFRLRLRLNLNPFLLSLLAPGTTPCYPAHLNLARLGSEHSPDSLCAVTITTILYVFFRKHS